VDRFVADLPLTFAVEQIEGLRLPEEDLASNAYNYATMSEERTVSSALASRTMKNYEGLNEHPAR
jgi:hypothetical protein